FARKDTRAHLGVYVRGRISVVHRSHAGGIAARRRPVATAAIAAARTAVPGAGPMGGRSVQYSKCWRALSRGDRSPALLCPGMSGLARGLRCRMPCVAFGARDEDAPVPATNPVAGIRLPGSAAARVVLHGSYSRVSTS